MPHLKKYLSFQEIRSFFIKKFIYKESNPKSMKEILLRGTARWRCIRSVYILYGLMAVIVSLPVVVVAREESRPLRIWLDDVGSFVWFFGLFFGSVAGLVLLCV